MVDHHVDRPGVEAEQSVELTGTNRSIDALERRIQRQGSDKDAALRISVCNRAADNSREDTSLTRTTRSSSFPARTPAGGLAGLVAIARGKTPDPIPNSAVKTLSADGTAS